MKTAPMFLCLVLTGCAITSHDLNDDARVAHREHLAEWCRVVGPCVTGWGGMMPAPEAPALPVYDDVCGYLPAVYGDDC